MVLGTEQHFERPAPARGVALERSFGSLYFSNPVLPISDVSYLTKAPALRNGQALAGALRAVNPAKVQDPAKASGCEVTVHG